MEEDDMDLENSLERLREIFIGDLEDLQRLAITIALSVVLLVIFIFVSKWIKKLITKKLGKRLEDTLLVNFISVSVRTLILLFGIILIMRFLGLTAAVGGLMAGAGITAFVIGFALKDIGENFLSGILLAFKRPFKVGDIVDINGHRGKVVTLNLRDTQIKSFEGKDIFMPNANIIKNPLINFTIDGFLNYNFVVGLDYGTDYAAALKLMKGSIQKVQGVLKPPKGPTVFITELTASTLNVKVTFWVNTYNRKFSDDQVRSNAILTVLTDLEKAGYNLPGDIIELKNHQGLPIKQEKEVPDKPNEPKEEDSKNQKGLRE